MPSLNILMEGRQPFLLMLAKHWVPDLVRAILRDVEMTVEQLRDLL